MQRRQLNNTPQKEKKHDGQINPKPLAKAELRYQVAKHEIEESDTINLETK